ncbi:MAG: T9SS type A sorting domain-containing protein [Crocinitomicaceae bacterium]|nr:T9SS type A sorting domain-containing protein [Crocinitomicaceae bacterium]
MHTEVAYIVVDKPAAPTGTGDIDCPGYTASLTATGTGGTLNWYDDAIGGTLVNTGTTYNPVISTPTSYFVEELVDYPIQTVGPADNTYGGGGYFDFDTRGLFFDAIAPFEFISVTVYAESPGTRTIQILDGDGGSVVHTMDANLVTGENVVTLNWDIDAYSGYWMTIDGFVELYRNNDAATAFPYTIPGLVSITGNNVTGGDAGNYYYFFYDWNVREPGCVSERVEILADTEPVPAITLSGDVTIIGGESTTLAVTGAADTYLWTPATGLDDPSSMTPVASPVVTTTYTCTASFTGGCSSEESLTVTVDGQLGAEEIENDAEISIFPNPSSGLINIMGEGIAENNITILNAAGQVVAAKFIPTNDNSLQVDLSNLERGMYFINILSEDRNVVERIVLQ